MLAAQLGMRPTSALTNVATTALLPRMDAIAPSPKVSRSPDSTSVITKMKTVTCTVWETAPRTTEPSMSAVPCACS